MQEHTQLEPVSFRGETIFALEHQGEPFAPVRPIVENMGLNWASQYTKLQGNIERWSVVIITTVAADSKNREVVCIPLRKIAGFLATINHKKVRPELQEKVLSYQLECDDALWKYWSEGRAERVRYMEGNNLPKPGLSMDAIAGLCREADKYLKGKASLRALHYFTGMPVNDLLAEIEAPDPTASDLAAVMAQYLYFTLAELSEQHGLQSGRDETGPWVQGTTSSFFATFTVLSQAKRLPRFFTNPNHLGQLLAREAEALEFLGWRRSASQKVRRGYRHHRFTLVEVAEGGAA